MQVVDISAAPQSSAFEDFWLLYPRREAKKKAIEAWRKIPPSLHVEILTSLAAWRPCLLARGVEYIPLPATWLNGERWTDELPATITSAAHAPAVIPEKGERTEMPGHVREMIARLRRK